MKGHWIDNQWMEGDSKEFIEVRNPATEEILDRVSSGSEQDAKHAVESAKAAFEIWRKTPAIERAAMLHEASAKMRTHWNELVELLTLEEGKPVSENEEEMEWVAGTFDSQGTLWCCWLYHTLELSAALIVLEGCTCSGCRKHGGDQTIRDDPPLHLAVSRKML
jgi:hypothetical protein